MKIRFQFDAKVTVITPVEVSADSEQEALEKILRQDSDVIVYDTQYGEVELVQRSTAED